MKNLNSLISESVTIECIGMQGSGKTLATRYLHELNDVAVIENDARWLSTWKKHAFKFVVFHPWLFFWWFYTALYQSISVSGIKLFFHKFYLFMTACARWTCIHKYYPNNARVLDEGFKQHILSLYEYRLTRAQMRDIVRKFPRADVVLYFESEYPAGGIGKISKARSGFGEEYALEWKKVFAHNLQLLVSVLEDQGMSVYRCSLTKQGSLECKENIVNNNLEKL